MKIVIEVSLDESQLTKDDVDRLAKNLNESVPVVCEGLFWYRERKTIDYEVSVEIKDH